MALPPSASYPTNAKAAPWPSTWNWKEVSALTVAEVNDGWRRHMDFSQLSIITAGDFKKAAAAPGR